MRELPLFKPGLPILLESACVWAVLLKNSEINVFLLLWFCENFAFHCFSQLENIHFQELLKLTMSCPDFFLDCFVF